MKKIFLFAAAIALMASCNGGKTAAPAAGADTLTADTTLDSVSAEAADSAVFVGTVPAADGPGIDYRLVLTTDSSNMYTLTETYLAIDGKKDGEPKYYAGKVKTKKSKDGKKSYLVMMPSRDEQFYFLQLNDSTLRMVNSNLEEAVTNAENYDLKLQK